ncbi:DUF1553 domain-containing protein [Rhodopirellula europaea]|uniref:Secreted protein containing DUF1549 n=1 Tax=Rhodopirellula europaea 6C TaxID=1263867 RepID=M2AHG0_9BACT|nr:DUF1553 domain-containing protein [Rhodopirellula europaea]EMB16550.1 secreted protein containing DUF1549 [Rhodopirellula europaea 6C]
MNHRQTTLVFFALVLVVFNIESIHAEPVDFEKQIQPIFAAHCLECHGPDAHESGLRLDQRGNMLRGGDYGEATIVPNEPDASFLLRVVNGDEPDMQMPPEGPPLSPDQVSLLARWVQEGANWPGQMDAEADEVESDHWSLQPIADIQPSLSQTSQSHPIDAFVVETLNQRGLELSTQADAATLVRRVSLVLTGLPPTPEEVRAFVKHPEGLEVAYEELVTRLLDSPRYGVRWAQHWLDVIRWAETVGFETNSPRPNAWPYRDWIIKSLNDDKPYDRFLFEQLAGDTVGEDAALGFLVAGPANLPGQIGRDEEAMRQARQDELDEVIRTVSQGFFGLTIGCARCHNHKFDPILQRDYYSMQAVFAGLTYGERRLRGEQNDAMVAQVPAVRDQLKALRSELETLRKNHDLQPALVDLQTESFSPQLASSVRMNIQATANGAPASLYEFEAWTVATDEQPARNAALASSGARPSASGFALANQTRHFDNLVDGQTDRRQAFPWVSDKGGPAWLQVDFEEPVMIDRVVWDRGSSVPVDYTIEVQLSGSAEWQKVATPRNRMLREDDQRKADLIQLANLDSVQVQALVGKLNQIRQTQKKLNRLSGGPKVYAASFKSSPEPTWLLRRGDAMQPTKKLPPAIPVVLGDLGMNVDQPEPDRRVALAEHLTRPDHPLTARVIVNRVWQKHFGTGLVETPSDFGVMGAAPSHPELLDWLASDFVAGGWSLKRLHRLIVTSKTFQQSSQPNSEGIAIDAGSRLLWRFPARRLEAEAIRDSMLAASGKLNLKMGGPGFDFFDRRGGLADYTAKETFDESGWRRMIYAHKIRMQAVDIFGSFDCPDAGQMTPKRTRSITPIQSLSLLNSPFVNRQASYFADRVQAEVGDSLSEQIDHAFQIALSRSPSEVERSKMHDFASEHGLAQLCRILMNTSEFLYIQ